MAQSTNEPLVRIAELEIEPAKLDTYLDLLREEIETSVEIEPGVLSLHAMAVKGSPEKLRLVEIYADQEAYESHLKSPHFVKYKTMTATMVVSLKLIETEPIIMRAKAGRP